MSTTVIDNIRSPTTASAEATIKQGLSQNNKTSVLLGSSFLGVARVLVGFPIEHPIDAIRVQWQAQPHFKNEVAIIKHIYETKGVSRGFYAGALPNATRLVTRNIYKYPLLVGLPDLCKQVAPPSLQDRPSLMKFMTGFSIAMIESLITCPIDRTKVYLMTQASSGKKGTKPIMTSSYQQYWDHLTSSEKGKARELFRGFGPLFLRQFMSWTVFLQTDHAVKKLIRHHYQIAESEQISASLLVPASAVVALVNTTLVMPLDCIKTHLEKVNPSQSYLGAATEIYQQSGYRMSGFFTGVRLRFLLYLTNALFVVNILERIEHLKKQYDH